MPRPSKRVRDSMKQNGEWRIAPKQMPASWAAEAELFAAAAAEANPPIVPNPPGYHEFPEVKVPTTFFPDFGSVADVFSDALSQTNLADISELYSFVGPSDCNTFVALRVAFYVAMAVKTLVTSDAEFTSRSQPLVDMPLPREFAVAVAGFGSFRYGDTEYRFSDVSSTVKTFLRSAVASIEGASLLDSLSLLSAPVGTDDENFKAHLARALVVNLGRKGYEISFNEVYGLLFSGCYPDSLDNSASKMTDDVWSVVSPLFWEFKDYPSMAKHVFSGETLELLKEMGFSAPPCDPMFHRSSRDLAVIVNQFMLDFAESPPPGKFGANLRASANEGLASQLVLKRGGTHFILPPGFESGASNEDLVFLRAAFNYEVFCPGVHLQAGPRFEYVFRASPTVKLLEMDDGSEDVVMYG